MACRAVTLGNHEFDLGTAVLAGLIDGSAPGDFSALTGSTLEGLDFTGAAFPYLSANLGFATDPNLAPLEIAGGQAPQANVVTSSTVISMPANGASMLTGENGFSAVPIFTVGETFSGTTGALNSTTAGDYTPVGILDGLGAYELDANTVRVFANHELGANDGYAYEVSARHCGRHLHHRRRRAHQLFRHRQDDQADRRQRSGLQHDLRPNRHHRDRQQLLPSKVAKASTASAHRS